MLALGLLCGGLGTRLKQVTGDSPKALAELPDKRRIIDHVLSQWKFLNIDKYVFFAGYGSRLIEKHLKDKHADKNIEIFIDVGLGTGGAIAQYYAGFASVTNVETPKNLILLNCDTVYDFSPEFIESMRAVLSMHQRGAVLSIFGKQFVKQPRGFRYTVNTEHQVSECFSNSDSTQMFGNTGIRVLRGFETLNWEDYFNYHGDKSNFETNLIPWLLTNSDTLIIHKDFHGDFIDLGTVAEFSAFSKKIQSRYE